MAVLITESGAQGYAVRPYRVPFLPKSRLAHLKPGEDDTVFGQLRKLQSRLCAAIDLAVCSRDCLLPKGTRYKRCLDGNSTIVCW